MCLTKKFFFLDWFSTVVLQFFSASIFLLLSDFVCFLHYSFFTSFKVNFIFLFEYRFCLILVPNAASNVVIIIILYFFQRSGLEVGQLVYLITSIRAKLPDQ